MIYQPLLEYATPYIVKKTKRFSSFPIHMHHEIEIVYCIEGSLSVKIDGIKYEVKANEVLFIGSMTAHEYCSTQKGCVLLFIEFGAMLLREKFTFLSKVKFQNPVLSFSNLPNNDFKIIQDSIQSLLTLCDEKNVTSDLYVIGELYKLSSGIISTYKQNNISTPEQNNRYQIEKALELIYFNYQSEITTEDAALVSGYSKSNFCRNFKLTTGIGFHQYLIKYRITNSCYLLLTTDYSVEKISESVGYHDTRSFCRAFKQITNMTPMQYRRSKMNI